MMDMCAADAQRRRYPRQKVEAPVLVWSAVSNASEGWHGQCLNISPGGTGVVVAGPWITGQVVRMEVGLPGCQEPLQMAARVAYRNRLFCGFEFLAVSEPAMAALRNFCGKAES